VIHNYRSELAERERLRRKAAAWHTLWELGQARAALRRMGEVLPDPVPRSREAFADAIYALADNPDLTVLDGGVEDPLAGVAAAGRSDTGQALRHGGKPPLRSGESVAAHPQNFETEES
jgi:hypothetical protein